MPVGDKNPRYLETTCPQCKGKKGYYGKICRKCWAAKGQGKHLLKYHFKIKPKRELLKSGRKTI